MKVICDTTPFIALSSIGQIQLLKEIYSSIIVPRAIIEEVSEGGRINVPDLAMLDWVEVIPNIANIENRLLFQLDYGEQQVVLNALKLQPDLVLIDDRTARNIAEYLGLKIKSTLSWIFHECEGIICKAFEDTAVVDYCKPLITQQMGASHSPEG